jgi:hypothetical protein
MKEVKLVFMKGGKVKILAEGPNGKGTEKFTEQLAKELGTIEERHKCGGWHYHDEEVADKVIQQ